MTTSAPLCSTMYPTSAAVRRKLIGTRIRPHPLTPKNEVSKRAEFWEMAAIRAPTGTPSWSHAAAWERASLATSAYDSGIHAAAS